MLDDLREAPYPAPKLAVPVSSINILIVDDNPANRAAFETLLQPLGYSIFLASSGEEALALSTRYRFAVILMDVRMPVMDGLETAACLRRKPFSKTTPIVFVSAHQHTAEEVSRQSLDGPIGFVHSPVDSELLVWKVKSYVDLYLSDERLRLQSALTWHAQEQFEKALHSDAPASPALRQAGHRLGDALQGLKDLLTERLGMSGD